MKIVKNLPWACLAACALTAELAVSGCSGGSTAAQPPSSSPTTASSAMSTAPSTTSAPPPAPRTAADGKNYGVCASRSCEVAVSAPVHIRFRGSAPGTLAVTKVTADGIAIDVTLNAGGGGNGTLKPGCSTFVFHSAGGGSGTLGGGSGTLSGPDTTCADQPAAEPDAVTVQLPAMTNGVAILRIVTA